MKKTMALLLTLCVLLTLAACGKKGASGSLDLEKAQSDIAALEFMPTATLVLDDATLTDVYGVDASLLQSYLCVVPMMNVQASGYWLLLPKEGETGPGCVNQGSKAIKAPAILVPMRIMPKSLGWQPSTVQLSRIGPSKSKNPSRKAIWRSPAARAWR